MSLPSAIHVSSTFESGASRMSLLSAVRQFSILNFFRSPMNVIHASFTIESGAPRIDCLALFVHPPPMNLIRSPMYVIA